MATKRDLTTIQISTRNLRKIDRIAKAKGVSRSAVVRWAIDAYDPSFLENGLNVPTVKPVLPAGEQAAGVEPVGV